MYDIYTVKNGDTISSIATEFNTSPSILYQLNGLAANGALTPGMTIIVPRVVENPYFNYYTIKQGDTLYKVAQDNGIDYRLLAQINGLDINDYIYPNQTIMIPKQGVKYYLTKEADTLNSVANALGAGLNDLLSQNSKIYLVPEQLIVFKK